MINDQNAFSLFSQLKKSLNEKGGFCKPCKIWYISCNTGLSSFVQQIANATGCSVYAPKGYSRGTVKTRDHTIIQKETVDKDPVTGEERRLEDMTPHSQNGEKAEDDTFHVYTPNDTGYNERRRKSLYEYLF